MVSMHQASHVTSALDLPCCWWAYLTSPQPLEFYWFDVENRKLQLSLAQKKSRHIKTYSNPVTAAAYACFCGCSTFFFHLLVDLEELRTGFPRRRSSGKSEVLPKVSSSKAKSCLRKPAFGRAMGRLDFT